MPDPHAPRLSNFGLGVAHQLSYLYSLTEDDKEERAEDQGADDEEAKVRCRRSTDRRMFQGPCPNDVIHCVIATLPIIYRSELWST